MRAKRVKGCPNEKCELHVKKKRQKPGREVCPLCGTALVEVCRDCFKPFAEGDCTTILCLDCLERSEAKRQERRARLLHSAEKAEDAMIDIAVPVALGAAEVLISRGGKGVVMVGKRMADTAARTLVRRFKK